MEDKKTKAASTEVEISVLNVEEEPKPKSQKDDCFTTAEEKADESKISEPLIWKEKRESATLLSPVSDFTSTTLSPSKSEFSRTSIDEEKAQALSSPTTESAPQLTPRELKNKKRQRILDLSQRVTALILSIIILAVMTKAYITYRANQNVTAGGLSIYPTFMQLWPTYMMLTAGAVTVLLNACVVAWRVRGTMKDLEREEIYNKAWDYVLHGITGAIWLASSTSFRVTKDFGPAADPNVLWGYVCSPTAKQINAEFPEVVKFYIECQVQTVSFWMSVSAVLVEGFAVATKFFIRQ